MSFRNPGVFRIVIIAGDGKRTGAITSPAYFLKDGKLEIDASAPPFPQTR